MDSFDRRIFVESRSELIIRRGQTKYKTKDHEVLVRLPYRVKENGGTSTVINEQNIDRFMNAVDEIVKSSTSI